MKVRLTQHEGSHELPGVNKGDNNGREFKKESKRDNKEAEK